MPPRHGKSLLASQCFPAWCLGWDPGMSVLGLTYAWDLACRNVSAAKKIMSEACYKALFPETNPAEANFRFAHLGASLPNDRVNCLIVDDPLKNMWEASNSKIRALAWQWFSEIFSARQAEGAGIVMIQSRLHKNDIAGRILGLSDEKTGGAWRVLTLPAIAERDEEHRKRGEALIPEQWPTKSLREIRRSVGQEGWAAMYQQRPAAKGAKRPKDDQTKPQRC
jgi:hypothetical protein